MNIFQKIYNFLFDKQTRTKGNKPTSETNELYNTFDKNNHLQPKFDKVVFDAKSGWDFGWAILEPISTPKANENEILHSKRLSPGQKALFFIWYLDGEVTNGGFIQFYWNGKEKYLPPIIDGLKLIGDTQMLQLVDKATLEFKAHIKDFLIQKQKDDWEPLYDNLKKFEEYDTIYYATHDS